MNEDDAGVGVEETKVAVDEEHRDRDGDRRKHARRQDEHDEVLLAADAHPRKRIGGEGRDRDGDDRGADRDDHGVPQPRQHVEVATAGQHLEPLLEAERDAEHLLEGREVPVEVEQLRRHREDVAIRLERDRDPEIDRKREQRDDHPGEDGADDPL